MAIRIDSGEITSFRLALQNVPKDLRKEIRPAIRRAAQGLLQEVKANASWSSRIPAATRLKVSFAQRGAGISVVTDAKKAPHARPLEGGSQGRRAANRHPVFGNRDNWVNQPVRPFFFPAVAQHREQVVSEVQTALHDALGRL